MRISDWSSDVCSSDLEMPTLSALHRRQWHRHLGYRVHHGRERRTLYLRRQYQHQLQQRCRGGRRAIQIGRASCRERVCQYVSISVVAVSLKKTKTSTTETQSDNDDRTITQCTRHI